MNSSMVAQIPDERDVSIVEVSPRDGLQNDPRELSTAQKIDLIDCLVASGIQTIEPTSFVSLRAVPKLADAAEVMRGIDRRPNIRYICLVPNAKGLGRAMDAGVDAIAIFASATEEFSSANLNASIDETFVRFTEVLKLARAHNIWVRGYVSVSFHCPYSGKVPVSRAVETAKRLFELGCAEISLADTTGKAHPADVAGLIRQLSPEIPASSLSLHVHDTHGRAIDNVAAAYELGVRIFDGSAGGLGGCPFAPGAPGNIATETLVDYFQNRGIATGIDLAKLKGCSAKHLGVTDL